MRVRFHSRGSPEQISGGYLYNKYLIEYLRQAGIDISYHADPDDLAHADPGDIVIVDSIVMAEMATRLLSVSADLILLMHVLPDLAKDELVGRDVLGSLCQRSRVVVTGRNTLETLRSVVVDAGLDVVKIEPGIREDWRAKARYADKAKLLLGVANYIPGKQILRMLGVLQQLRHLSWTMTLHGNPDLDPRYFTMVADRIKECGLSDRVDLLGAVPHEIINERMLEADLLVHFSRYESYSMVTAEAIACGLPVLSYRTGNYGVFGQSGLVRYLEGVPMSEADSLAALIADERAYAQLRPLGQGPVRTWNDVGREFLAWLERR
jgi:glycosyltransferase involved in cell wall biosynthesis